MYFVRLIANIFVLVLTGFLISDCRQSKLNSADLVLINGFIYTVDSLNSEVEAVAITDGKFVFAGNKEDAGNYIGNETRVVDLGGKMVLPGFIDAHCHPISSYRYFYELNLYGLQTIPDFQKAIKHYLELHPDARYIKGRGWSDTEFPGRGPEKRIIDEIVKDIPVSFSSDGGHSIWVNSKTLELAGINKDTKNPPGGIIERDPVTKEPAGTLRESAADLVSKVFPAYSTEELMQGLVEYQAMALKFGITTAHDAYLDAGSTEPVAYRNLKKNDKLKMRFRASLYVDPEKGLEQIKSLIEERGKNKDPLFQTNAAKIFIDGVVEGSTAYLKEPYKHIPGSKGELLWDPDKLKNICSELERNNFQIHFHAIGDAATSVALDALDYAEKQNGKKGVRNLITHLQLVDTTDFIRFRNLGVIAVPQPYWFKKDNYYYNIQVPYLGLKRADTEYPMASFFNAGVIVASSSDYPVTVPCNPLIAIQTGITRTELNDVKGSQVLWPEERATLNQMIRSFTINGAYANFLEHETGSIEVGKQADLIVLDQDLFEIPVKEIHKAKVLLTIFNGKVAYQDSSFVY